VLLSAGGITLTKLETPPGGEERNYWSFCSVVDTVIMCLSGWLIFVSLTAIA
jgi:hypothetical protein